ncbi:type II secretion system secretin GspD [Kineobactrum salinum]|uniref:Type II secretion system secretin GspD n=2 Tax=Kineobactrum salinum TaxID=2708301 RepID=A0A6C0U650_9GAMM|nr:type II secretion system secretin GspD [Kineobactrum salinum]
MVSLLASCSLLDNQFRGKPYGKPDTGDSEQPAEPAAMPRSAEELAARQQAEKESERLQPSLYRGTDQPINMPALEEPIRLVGEDVSLNFEEAPLGEVVHAVLGDILGLDYIVDHPVQGNITLRSRTPIPRDQLLQVLESLLRANNVIMTRGADGRYLVTGSEQGTRLAPRLSNPESERAGYSTIVVPLQYISASNMAEILGPMAEEQAFLRVDNSRNLLILAGTQAQLDGWLDMIATFDVDLLKGMSVGLFPLENSRVEDAAQVLDGMLGSGSGDGGEGEGGQGSNNFSRLVRIIPVKRLNSLLVVTPRSHYLDTVGTWIERLDTTPDSNFEKSLHVYPVQNTTSSRLADLIRGIYSGGGGGGRSTGPAARSGATDRGVAPGMSMESIGSGSSSRSGRSSGSFGSGSSSGSSGIGSFGSSNRSSDTGGSTVTSIGGDEESEIADVRVVADEENNSLMIYATGKQYGIIEDALRQLDVVATQVIIEASILEVTLTEDLEYGLEWSFKNGLGGRYDGSGQQVSSGSAPSVSAPGFSYSITNPAGNINAVLNALSEDSLINVISSPSVMVLDNHTAYIHVGDQVAIRQGSLVSEGGTVTQNFQYRDTGVKLMVRPSVNAGGLVTMDVEQSVTDIGTATINEQPTFLERNIMSRVAVRSDESVVLGGLIRENASSRDSGVPLLHRIPVLGALFGSTVNNNRRTELLVIITPRVLANETELREVSQELRSRVRHMQLIDDPLLEEPLAED